MTRKQRRLTIIGGALAVLALAAGLVLYALGDAIVFFSTPTMVALHHIEPGKRFRLGGLVQPGSLKRDDDLAFTFEVADGNAKIPLAFRGDLPDLFHEGQGVVAEACSMFPVCSWPTRCWQSMMRITCPKKSPTR